MQIYKFREQYSTEHRRRKVTTISGLLKVLSQHSVKMEQANQIKTEVALLFGREDEIKEKVKMYENDRKILLLRISKISNKPFESDKQLELLCDSIKTTLREGALILENPQNDSTNNNKGIMKKCRYYNRGFCKFQKKCNFVHPTEI